MKLLLNPFRDFCLIFFFWDYPYSGRFWQYLDVLGCPLFLIQLLSHLFLSYTQTNKRKIFLILFTKTFETFLRFLFIFLILFLFYGGRVNFFERFLINYCKYFCCCCFCRCCSWFHGRLLLLMVGLDVVFVLSFCWNWILLEIFFWFSWGLEKMSRIIFRFLSFKERFLNFLDFCFDFA